MRGDGDNCRTWGRDSKGRYLKCTSLCVKSVNEEGERRCVLKFYKFTMLSSNLFLNFFLIVVKLMQNHIFLTHFPNIMVEKPNPYRRSGCCPISSLISILLPSLALHLVRIGSSQSIGIVKSQVAYKHHYGKKDIRY